MRCTERCACGLPSTATTRPQHGHSTAAEVRDIFQSAVSSEGRVKLGSLLADMGQRAKFTDAEFAVFEPVRSKAPAGPLSFE